MREESSTLVYSVVCKQSLFGFSCLVFLSWCFCGSINILVYITGFSVDLVVVLDEHVSFHLLLFEFCGVLSYVPLLPEVVE